MVCLGQICFILSYFCNIWLSGLVVPGNSAVLGLLLLTSRVPPQPLIHVCQTGENFQVANIPQRTQGWVHKNTFSLGLDRISKMNLQTLVVNDRLSEKERACLSSSLVAAGHTFGIFRQNTTTYTHWWMFF